MRPPHSDLAAIAASSRARDKQSPAADDAAAEPASDPARMQLADALATAILDASGNDTAGGRGSGPATPVQADAAGPGQPAPLVLIRRCAEAKTVTRELTQRAVEAARAAGLSWAAIGAELDMSRQAAQQRFGSAGAPAPVAPDGDPQERWLGPVTAFDEMAELAVAGRAGWHVVEAGMLGHRMVRTGHQWEHARILWPRSPKTLLGDGWQIGCRAFPWIYLIRDTGLPAAGD